MTYAIDVRVGAKRAIARLPTSVAAACLEFIRGPLAESPYRVGNPLRNEWEGFYSARRGVYRVIYRIDNDDVVVEVVEIAHRREVYHS